MRKTLKLLNDSHEVEVTDKELEVLAEMAPAQSSLCNLSATKRKFQTQFQMEPSTRENMCIYQYCETFMKGCL